MIEKEIFIDSGEGQMNTFIVHPDENDPHPVILFLMDAPGKGRNCIRWHEELRLAGTG